ncbi:MAG: anhydro-N-acetylmuramic acid kinase [Spirochaetes bacterium GWB1_59_5]|nr:MAG: anhydro-N-acetylmuramic acid kinase [Spirochaetes bacterium GWB1_59_5]
MPNSRDEVGFRSAYAARPRHLVIGLMSGTSLDGVDAALVSIETETNGVVASVKLLEHQYLPYSDAVRARVAALCSPETARIDDLTFVHYGLSEWYARAVFMVIKASGLSVSSIDAISMHGQTVWHAPIARAFPGPDGDLAVKGTLQLGSSAVLRERTGIPVISDLRARDMAAGGEGAPLAPYIDSILFGSDTEGRIVQNIGGIGNATVIPAHASMDMLTAFDTGPGNMLMDAVVIDGTGGAERYDPEGRYGAAGKVAETVVRRLMADPYFSRLPPKSTGREVYGAAFARAFIDDTTALGLDFNDRVATATAFTAESIAAAYRDFILGTTNIATVLVAGGGALNPTLLSMIQERLPAGIRVTTTAALGVPDQAREAIAFAVIGHQSLMGKAGNLPAVTGARCPVVLGCITL